MAVGDPPYTPADVNSGSEQELLKSLYDEALAREPDLGPSPDAMPGGLATVQLMLRVLAKSKALSGIVVKPSSAT